MPDVEAEVPLSPAPLAAGPASPVQVLIVDDVASTRRFLRAVLEHCRDFDVVGEADDGAAAIEMANDLQPDLVLLDLSMPLVDGPSALKGVLQVAPNAKVIVVSGMNQTAGPPMLDAGATAFVPKGITPIELLERLGEILGDAE
jgi:two-component system chemotaxis response regulator CheY